MRRTISAILAAAALAAMLGTTAIAAIRQITMEPNYGAAGTRVHIQIFDNGPHAPVRDLVIWLMSPTAPECGPADATYPLGVITWSGSIGTADFVVPDLPPGYYYVAEVLPEVNPPCMPVGPFKLTSPLTGVPDTALSVSADASPISPVELTAILGSALVLLASFRFDPKR